MARDIITCDLVSYVLADEVEHEEDSQSLYYDITQFVDEIKKNLK